MSLAPHIQTAVDREIARGAVRPHWARRAVSFLPGGAQAMAIAKGVVETHDRTVDRLVALAEEHDVEPAKIDKALRAYNAAQKAQALVALLVPVVPSVEILRVVGGVKKARQRVRRGGRR